MQIHVRGPQRDLLGAKFRHDPSYVLAREILKTDEPDSYCPIQRLRSSVACRRDNSMSRA